MKTKTMIVCALFAAVMCVFSVISVQIGPIPITLGLFGVMITAVILGPENAVKSTAIFILLGLIGLPVFAGCKGGIGVLLGATGGYIWSYTLTAYVIGLFSARAYKNKWLGMTIIFASCIVGIAICYFLGTIQYMHVSSVDFSSAIAVCVLPFIPFDILKAVIATVAGYEVRRALVKASLI